MKILYRPDIDGLRAIAVLSVIFYHSMIPQEYFNLFHGGFLGVDIFFTISGYLITKIILCEITKYKNISLKNFYERRARRILPALFVVILTFIPVAWIHLLPLELIDFTNSILSSIGFSSNFYFYLSNLEYGTKEGLLKPFLHTWSLSVEEQFYILFPVLLYFVYKTNNCRRIIYIFLFIFLISLLSAQFFSRTYSSINFYMLPTRAWELVAGSIICYLEINKKFKFKNLFINEFFSFLGLLFIIFSLILYKDTMPHPSIVTLLPITGVCLIILFSNTKTFVKKILSYKILVFVGLISYSLYLWHYPIFAFNRILEFTDGNNFRKLVLISLVFILSVFTYFFVEKPFRNKKLISLKFFVIFISFSLFIFLTFISSVILNNGFSSRYPLIFKNLFIEKKNNLKVISEDINYDYNNFSKINIVFLGDSVTGTLVSQLREEYGKLYNIINFASSGCQFILYHEQVKKNKSGAEFVDNRCDLKANQKKIEIIKNLNKDQTIIVYGGILPAILSGEWFDNKEGGVYIDPYINSRKTHFYFKNKINNKNLTESILDSINYLADNSKALIIIYPVPEVGFNPSEEMIKIFHYKTKKKDQFPLFDKFGLTTSYTVYKERIKESDNVYSKISKKNVYKIFPEEIFCSEDNMRCKTHSEKNFYYFDNLHPTTIGAQMINSLLLKKIKEIM